MSKVFAAATKVVMSYCFPREGDVASAREDRGWVSHLSEAQLLDISHGNGFELTAAVPFNTADDFDQKILVFGRAETRV